MVLPREVLDPQGFKYNLKYWCTVMALSPTPMDAIGFLGYCTTTGVKIEPWSMPSGPNGFTKEGSRLIYGIACSAPNSSNSLFSVCCHRLGIIPVPHQHGSSKWLAGYTWFTLRERSEDFFTRASTSLDKIPEQQPTLIHADFCMSS